MNDDDIDPLAPARGIIVGLILGLAFFAFIGVIVAALV